MMVPAGRGSAQRLLDRLAGGFRSQCAAEITRAGAGVAQRPLDRSLDAFRCLMLAEMVEHHRGAIAMSRIVLRETKDSKVRMMANKAVAEQTREVGELEGWLKAHGKRAQ